MVAEAIDAAAARRLRAPLLRWYRRAKRDLPWRRTTDPYAIWVSEVMLQQTTVAAVIPYWERFLARFPDAASLARGREEEVLALWSGLGYYRRARALHEGAIAVMGRHGGSVPGEVEALTDLPGIGRYTAGAIASLAFGRAAPVVDGNIKRVFSRLFAIRGLGSAAERAYWSIAEILVRGPSPGDWNQALMELGATVCTPRAPRCGACPLAAACQARTLGRQEAFPTPPKRKATRFETVAAAWIERRARVLLARRHAVSPVRGSWDLPVAAIPEGSTPERAIASELQARYGVRLRMGAVLLTAKHSILSTRLDIAVIEAVPVTTVPRRAALRWVALDDLDGVAVSGATKKIVRAVLAQRRSQDPRGSASSGSSGRANA